MKINLSSGVQTFPLIEMLDIDGNQIDDLLLSDDDDAIKIHLAKTASAPSYERRGSKFDFDMPSNNNRIVDADLNGDGKDDLVVTYTKADGDTKLNQVTVLYAQ
jgi:hypothetical protein